MGATMTRDGRGRRDRPGHPVAMAIAVLLALIALAGCRKPDPVYDRVPRPVGTRDIVRAERRDGTMLSEAERLAVLGAHDRYIAAFDALRQAELVPFAEELRSADAESIARDERKLRSLVSRHLGIIGRIESLDESFLTEVSAALGPGREGFVARLRNRRVLDRASALSAGDGGRALLDVRQLVDQLALGESDRIATEPLLQEFETQAVSIAAEITREQATLPLSYLAVLERRGSAESSVDGSLRDDARRKEGYAQSRNRAINIQKTTGRKLFIAHAVLQAKDRRFFRKNFAQRLHRVGSLRSFDGQEKDVFGAGTDFMRRRDGSQIFDQAVAIRRLDFQPAPIDGINVRRSAD